MASVYILRSLKTGKKYVGSTSWDPIDRLSEHNAGKVPWTRAHRPLELIYTEVLKSVVLAEKRERFFKTGKGRLVLKSLLESKGLVEGSAPLSHWRARQRCRGGESLPLRTPEI
jgi:putative endonuclease